MAVENEQRERKRQRQQSRRQRMREEDPDGYAVVKARAAALKRASRETERALYPELYRARLQKENEARKKRREEEKAFKAAYVAQRMAMLASSQGAGAGNDTIHSRSASQDGLNSRSDDDSSA